MWLSSIAWRWFGFKDVRPKIHTAWAKILKWNGAAFCTSHVAKLLRMKCRRLYILPQQPICGQAERLNHTSSWQHISLMKPATPKLLSADILLSRWPHRRHHCSRSNVLASWSLPKDRMVCMTTDSEANVVSALWINKWQCLPCFGHRCFCEMKFK